MTNIKSSLPKYKIIGEQLIDEILNQSYKIGDVLATEKGLCLTYNVSRHTVREALRYVEQVGLISRRQGSGSKVIATKMPETINHVVTSVNDLLQHGNDTIFKLQHADIIRIDQSLAYLLNANNNDHCMRIAGVRIEPHDKKPVCFTTIYRLPDNPQSFESCQASNLSFKTIIEGLDTKNISKVEQTISACLMPVTITKVLGANENSAALKIIRRYFSKNNNNLILTAESIYAENRFSYSSVLYPD